MRTKYLLAAGGAGLLLLVPSACPAPPALIWNRTESVPAGLYLISADAPVNRSDLVGFRPSGKTKRWLEDAGYTGRNWPLLKRAAALRNDTVCRCGDVVRVNGTPVAEALRQDSSGRALPDWQGCRTLGADEIFLLADHPASLDGRYFGVQPRSGIIGVARPVLVTGPAAGQGPEAVDAGAKARRARLRDCHTTSPDSLSAHPFSCDTSPEARCRQTILPASSDD